MNSEKTEDIINYLKRRDEIDIYFVQFWRPRLIYILCRFGGSQNSPKQHKILYILHFFLSWIFTHINTIFSF